MAEEMEDKASSQRDNVDCVARNGFADGAREGDNGDLGVYFKEECDDEVIVKEEFDEYTDMEVDTVTREEKADVMVNQRSFASMAAKRKIRDEWLLKEKFKPQLSKVDSDPTKAFCNKSSNLFNADLTTIKRHKMTSVMADYHNTEELISEVEKRPALWNPSNEQYKNKKKKVEAWLEVCHSVYLDYEEKTAEEKKQIGKELQIRWKSIRDSYIRNCRKLKDESKTGTGAVKTQRYVFAEQLSFLRKVGECRGTTDTMPINHGTEDGAEDAYQNLSTIQPKASAEIKKRKRNLHEEKLMKFMDGCEEKEDEDKDFFMSMLPSVRKLNSEQKLEFRMQLLAALQNFKSGRHRHTRIQDSHPSPLVLPPAQCQYRHYPQYPSSAMTRPHFFGPPTAANIPHPHTGNTHEENHAQVQPPAPSPDMSVPSPASYTSNTDNSISSLNDFDI